MAKYFGPQMTSTTIGVMLNWGPIIGIVFFPISTWIFARVNGLQKAIWAGLALNLVGNIIRCIPILVKETGINQSFPETTVAYVCYHTGQILIAAAGPFFMGSVTKLSCVWFAEEERTTATALATTANGLGTTIGFLNPQWLTVPEIFWLSLVLAVVCIVCGCIYLPAGPPEPPSAAAAAATAAAAAAADGDGNRDGDGDGDGDGSTYLRTIKVATMDRSFVLLVVAAAVLSGVNSGWTGLLQLILAPANINQSKIGLIGMGNAAAGNIAAVCAGGIMDRYLKRRLKFGIIIGLIGCLLSTCWFSIQLPCFLWNDGIVARSEFTLVLALTLAGFFQGATTPLFYELAAELIYPVKEGMSAGILVLLLNLSAAIVICVQNVLSSGSMNMIATCSVFSVLVLVVFFVREIYTRPKN